MHLSPETPLEPSDEQLGRLVIRVLAGVVGLVLAAGIASAAGRVNEGAGSGDEIAEAGAVLSLDDGIGPLAGTDLDAYSTTRRAALSDAAGRRSAVVSFVSYVSPKDMREMLASVEVRRALVAIPGGRPVEAPADDIMATLRRQREEAAEEKSALDELLPTVDDPEFKQSYREDIERLTRLLAAGEVTKVVYGAVVVGSADQLRALAKTPSIRLVDVGPTAVAPPEGSVAGIRPEELTRAGEPPTRPLP